MSELSPRGQALLHASRAALRPGNEDRERVLAGLRERLGSAAIRAARRPPRAMWLLGAAALLGAGAALAFGLGAGRQHVEVARSVPAAVPVAQPASSPASARLPEAPAPAVTSASGGAVPPPPSRRATPDRLAEEVALLSQAAKDLRAGHAASALSALNEHQKKFPNGALSQERRAARAEALCALGRGSEAQSELALLERRAPKSPLLVRARQRCQAP
jgi:TolA-binding protein